MRKMILALMVAVMAVGVMGRLVYAPLKLNDVRVNTVSPGIIGTFTFN